MRPEMSGQFLSKLTPLEAADLQVCGRKRKYEKGRTLFFQGDPPDYVVVILEGRVKISTLTEEGKEVVLSITGPGDILGEISAIDGEPRSATATAVEPIEAQVIRSEDFRSFLEANPRVALLIIRMLAGRLRAADRRRIEFSALDSVARVANFLVELADRYGEPHGDVIRIGLSLTQSEIAGAIGSSREAVNKALQALRREEWIQTHRRAITVLDLEGLKRRAG